jgi:hypothetical protein
MYSRAYTKKTRRKRVKRKKGIGLNTVQIDFTVKAFLFDIKNIIDQ